jgi:NAD(P)-dependent dehydrogenase (short-subunit alcohol dehydrogenase family)
LNPSTTHIVAGGGSGIGRALVERLADEGRSVQVLDVRESAFASALVRSHRVDLRSYGAVKEVADDLGGRHEGIQAIAMVAGSGYTTSFETMTPGDFSAQVESNLTITFNVFRAFLPHLTKGSALVAVSSVNAYGGVGSCAYAAAKAGVIGLVKSLALELSPRGIRVNAVVPGAVRTPMLDAMMTPTQQSILHRMSPLGSGQPDQVAAVIDALLGPATSHVTGQAWVVDGGLSVAYRPAL